MWISLQRCVVVVTDAWNSSNIWTSNYSAAYTTRKLLYDEVQAFPTPADCFEYYALPYGDANADLNSLALAELKKLRATRTAALKSASLPSGMTQEAWTALREWQRYELLPGRHPLRDKRLEILAAREQASLAGVEYVRPGGGARVQKRGRFAPLNKGS